MKPITVVEISSFHVQTVALSFWCSQEHTELYTVFSLIVSAFWF